MFEVKLEKTNIFLPSYRGRLLEGATYNKDNNTLLWVDIIQAEVHRVSLEDEAKVEETHEVLKFASPDESIGAVLLTNDPDTVLVCAKYGIATASFKTNQIQYLVKYPLTSEKAAMLRSNDGIIDPWGNIWIGLMEDFPVTKANGKVSPNGCLYRISASDLSIKTMIENTYISNGLTFSNDGSKLYWTDSLTFTVWQFDYDHEKIELSNKQPLIDMRSVYPDNNSPEPDGLCSTQCGEVFHAVFGTSTVLKYSVDGKPEGKFCVPAERITCTCIGGPNDNELFITTGHQKLDDFSSQIDASDKSGDLGGFLFRVTLEGKVNSTPSFKWQGKLHSP